MQVEPILHNLIEELYQDIKDSTPADGFSSPRDIALVTEVNRKSAVLDKLQEAMQITIPTYDIKGQS